VISGQTTGTGGLTVNNGSAGGTGGALTINNNTNSYSGGTTVNAGTLTVGANGALGTGALNLNGGILNNSALISGMATNIAVGGTTAIQLGSNNNMILSGTLSGAGTLTLGNSGNNGSAHVGLTNTMTSGTITLANNTNSVRFINAAAGNANVAWVINNGGANRDTLDFADGGTILPRHLARAASSRMAERSATPAWRMAPRPIRWR
jgi:fibronectin-binding autotransporter adhesin